MKINDIDTFGIDTFKMDLDSIFPESGLYVELREMTSGEIVNIPKDNDSEIFNYLSKLLPVVMVSHNFEDEKGNLYPIKKVADAINRKSGSIGFLIEYQKKMLPKVSNMMKSDK